MKFSTLLLLGLASLAGCSSSTNDLDAGPDAGDADPQTNEANGGKDDGGKKPGNGKPDADTGKPDSGTDEEDSGPGKDAGGGDTDAGGTDLLTCEDEAIECGIIRDDGAGNELDCSTKEGNPTGTEKACESYETCEDNVCVCESQFDLPEDEQPQCGIAVDCTEGGRDLGGCVGVDGREGANWFCSPAQRCECEPIEKAVACDGRECGTAVDGCGGSYDCGDLEGACAEGRACDSDAKGAKCDCDPDYDFTAFCDGKCGTQVLNGCGAECEGGAACTACGTDAACDSSCSCDSGQVCGVGATCCSASTAAELCVSQACGTQVTDPCTGQKFTCGCGEGEGCVEARFISDSAKNVCQPTHVAQLVGRYAVRTHNFTQTSSVLGTDVSRSEATSLVTVELTLSPQPRLTMIDEGCAATTDNAATVGRQRSISLGYSYAPDSVVPLEISPTSWLRPFAAAETPAGKPEPTGWISDMPSYCPGATAGDTDDGPGLSNGQDKEWLSLDCTCPAVEDTCDASVFSSGDADAIEQCLPNENTGELAAATDCRINDVDHDGNPGLTLFVNGTGFTGTEIYMATVADVEWNGTSIAPDGFHTGFAREPVDILRKVLACDPAGALGGAVCSGASSAGAQTCGAEFNAIRFVRLSGQQQNLQCSYFYSGAADGGNATIVGPDALATSLSDLRQDRIDNFFKSVNVTCTTNADCPVGTICHDPMHTSGTENSGDGQCWPMTTPGACAGSSSCDDAGDLEWECSEVDRACWPAGSASNDGCRP